MLTTRRRASRDLDTAVALVHDAYRAHMHDLQAQLATAEQTHRAATTQSDARAARTAAAALTRHAAGYRADADHVDPRATTTRPPNLTPGMRRVVADELETVARDLEWAHRVPA